MENKIIVSQEAPDLLIEYFQKKGFEVCLLKKQKKPYASVASHPDIFTFYDEKLFVEGQVDQVFIEGQVRCESIGDQYPDNVKFNVCKLGDYVICKYGAVSKTLQEHIQKKGYQVLDVKQGYAKCSVCVVDDQSIITSDKGIMKACLREGLDVLLIEPGHIRLRGMPYGFIGGASGVFEDIVFFNGAIENHPDYEKIKYFVESKNKKIESMPYDLEDLGSFIVVR